MDCQDAIMRYAHVDDVHL